MDFWFTASLLLGAGVEHLNGEDRKQLAILLVELGAAAIHRWTVHNARVDFTAARNALTTEEALKDYPIEALGPGTNVKGFVNGVVDLIEFGHLSDPLRRVVHHLCEQVRHQILAMNLTSLEFANPLESILLAIWLIDINPSMGQEKVLNSLKGLPSARFLRVNLATHFLTRVYWSHWKAENRKILLEVAEQAIKPAQLGFNKGALKRVIDNTSSTETKKSQ